MTGRPVLAFCTGLACVATLGCGGGDSGSPAGSGAGGSGGGSGKGLTCSDAPPPGATEAPDPPAYTGGTCPTLTTGIDTRAEITSSAKTRRFAIIVPDQPTPGATLPVVFLWHWLNASPNSFYERAFVQDAVNQQQFIAVIPESLKETSGVSDLASAASNWRGWFALNGDDVREEEFVFFDDMLSCVSAQFPVNKNCVSSAGVSDGALWTSQLIGGRGKYLSSAIVLSGGVNDPNVSSTSVVKAYIPSTEHVMPAIVLWGGPNDNFVIGFEPATKALEQHMDAEGHLIIECQHNCGHDEPPFEPPPGKSKFAAFWDFVNDHPYWTEAGHSPYETTGLPDAFPPWCAIGVGQAVARTDTGCANLIGGGTGP
jgi:hypothetical protein